jgi:Kef-type K+ transport system membrane component KefB
VVLKILLCLPITLVGAKLADQLSRWFGMPAVFGELLLGLILGLSLLDIITHNETLYLIGQIGVIALRFMADLETEIDVGKASLLTALGGVLPPLGAGELLGLAFGMQPLEALFLGGVLTATSVSISSEVLCELSGYAPSSAQPF